ncbi:MAG TPA: HAMP domain-containing sensor histidine kinase [Patescibacteria group bacterium]|nr:HAMP domain-containing sensor histidine kinase [Patescibacteria group bacterium]
MNLNIPRQPSREELLAQIQEVENAKNEFVSIASHQLRTPLTAIRWSIELMKKSSLENLTADQKDFLQDINVSVSNMSRLIGDLLTISRIDMHRKFDYVFEKVNLTNLIAKVIEEQMITGDTKDVKIVYKQNAKKPIHILTDREKIQQALQNIVNNAVKYSKDGGTVKINCKETAKKVLIKIKDDGIGIPKSQQKKIFEKFYRCDNAVLTNSGGTGLGLYIVNEIVSGHGGKVWFESKLKKGTTFFISLPKK